LSKDRGRRRSPGEVSALKVILLALFLVALPGVALGLSVRTQLTPENLAEKDFQFTIVPGNEGGRTTFKIAVKPKAGIHFPETVEGILTLNDGKRKRRVGIPVGAKLTTFPVPSECLPESTFEFQIYPASANRVFPGMRGYWFYLRDFVDRK
jgi:hypothetical protein